jgi:hypothetical protein
VVLVQNKKDARIGGKYYLAAKTTRTTNAMDVKLTVIWEIIIYDKRNLKMETIQSITPSINA